MIFIQIFDEIIIDFMEDFDDIKIYGMKLGDKYKAEGLEKNNQNKLCEIVPSFWQVNSKKKKMKSINNK